MSNVKQVIVRGVLPFHIDQDERARSWLGHLNAPSYGLRIKYAAHYLVDNDRGGKTTMYEFTIAGTEAIAFAAYDDLIDALEAAGARIDVHDCTDIEDGWT